MLWVRQSPHPQKYHRQRGKPVIAPSYSTQELHFGGTGGWSNQAIWWKRKELQAKREVLRRSDHVLGTARSDTVPVPGEHVGKYQLLNTCQSDYVSELMSTKNSRQFHTCGGINRGLSCCTKEFDSYFEDTRKPWSNFSFYRRSLLL